jgi:hypothetical protein
MAAQPPLTHTRSMFILASSALSIVRFISAKLALVCSSDTGMMFAPLAYVGTPLTLK